MMKCDTLGLGSIKVLQYTGVCRNPKGMTFNTVRNYRRSFFYQTDTEMLY